jgi:hypothetical protein
MEPIELKLVVGSTRPERGARNQSVPAVLKNAIDSVFVSNGFRNKPAGFVGYVEGELPPARQRRSA